VWEWCLNEYSNPDNTQVGGTSRRVLRGGSFILQVFNARAASRGHGYPNYIYRDLGFRVVSAPVGVLDSE
jgi:formylglycine-generating enzyme required for sulfatase activity